jgi:phosphatidylglycerol:prolipoprotein diacylglycerol transferase
MFPDFRYLIYGLTGSFPPSWVGLFKTFGAMVAIAFLAATWVMIRELKRKEGQGLIQPIVDEKTGNKVWPHQKISEIVMIAAIGGLIGAKVFNAFETWDDFVRDPIGSLFSRSGLTFYGGLIVATAIFYYYARKNKIRFAHLCDAAAPAVMIAYGIGRLGCQFAGDGDWGIYNSAYVTMADGSLQQVNAEQGASALRLYAAGYGLNAHKIDTMHSYAPAPSASLRWLWAQNYPMNVANDGQVLPDAPSPEYNRVLPLAVFPTPVYESIAGIALFFFLWGIRHRLRRPWQMFGIYLILTGAERFLVELIRVNYKYDWGFIHPTQAEIISVALMLSGLLLILMSKRTVRPAALPADS